MSRKAPAKISVVVSIVVLLATILACAPAATPIQQKTIKIGGLFTMTGAMAGWIGSGATAIQDYVRYVDEDLGGFEYIDSNGKNEKVKLELMWEDHSWQIPKCISIYERFKGAGVQYLMSHGSVPTGAIANFAVRDQIPGSTVSSVMDPPMYPPYIEKPYIIANGDPIVEVAAAVIYYIKTYKWQESRPLNLGIIAFDAPSRRVYSSGDIMSKYCQKLGGVNLIGIDYIALAPVDTSIELERQAAKNVDWIILDTTAAADITILKDAQRLGMWKPGGGGKVKFFAFLPDEKIVAKDAALFENIDVMSPVIYKEGVPGCDLANKIIKKYHPEARPGIELGNFYLWAFADMLYVQDVLKRALEKVGYENLTGSAIRDALFDSTKPIDSMGIQPVTYLDPIWPIKTAYAPMSVIHEARFCSTDKVIWVESPPLGFAKPRWNPKTPAGVDSGYFK